MRQLAVLETELETSKIQLTLRPDFNLPDAFTLFTQTKDIRIDEFVAALNLFEMPVSSLVDVNLVLKRYSNGAMDF